MRLKPRKMLRRRMLPRRKKTSFKKRLCESILQRNQLLRKPLKIQMSLRFLQSLKIDVSMSATLSETLIVMRKAM